MSALDGLSAPRYRLGMAKEIPSVGDLRRKSEITDAEIEAATAAFLADRVHRPSPSRPAIGSMPAEPSTCICRRRSFWRTNHHPGPPCAARW